MAGAPRLALLQGMIIHGPDVPILVNRVTCVPGIGGACVSGSSITACQDESGVSFYLPFNFSEFTSSKKTTAQAFSRPLAKNTANVVSEIGGVLGYPRLILKVHMVNGFNDVREYFRPVKRQSIEFKSCPRYQYFKCYPGDNARVASYRPAAAPCRSDSPSPPTEFDSVARATGSLTTTGPRMLCCSGQNQKSQNQSNTAAMVVRAHTAISHPPSGALTR
jgi:hypothetical protein